jgi:hypothetical protein
VTRRRSLVQVLDVGVASLSGGELGVCHGRLGGAAGLSAEHAAEAPHSVSWQTQAD